jgi:hypothetical protein
MNFTISHGQEAQDDSDPVHIVGDNRTIGSGVLPAENSIEKSPSTTTVKFRIAELQNIVSAFEIEGRG